MFILNLWNWQLHVESGALVGTGGVGPDAALVRLHHTFDERKTKAGPSPVC